MSPEYQALLQRLREQHTLEEVERIEATYCQVWPDPARRLEMLRFVVERLDSQSRRPTWSETVNGKPRRQRESRPEDNGPDPGPLSQDFFKTHNAVVDELLDVMSEPVLKGYLVGSRLADKDTLRFWISHEKLAEKIGATGKSRRHHGRRIADRLLEAGLWKLKRRSRGPGTAHVYTIALLPEIDLARAREILSRPLNAARRPRHGVPGTPTMESRGPHYSDSSTQIVQNYKS